MGYLAYSLLAGGVLLFLSPAFLWGLRFVWEKIQIDHPTDEIEGLPQLESSDTPAPPGFVQHLERIRKASQSATAEQREDYYFDALTRTQTLEKENSRLNSRGDRVAKPKPPSPPDLDTKVSP